MEGLNTALELSALTRSNIFNGHGYGQGYGYGYGGGLGGMTSLLGINNSQTDQLLQASHCNKDTIRDGFASQAQLGLTNRLADQLTNVTGVLGASLTNLKDNQFLFATQSKDNQNAILAALERCCCETQRLILTESQRNVDATKDTAHATQALVNSIEKDRCAREIQDLKNENIALKQSAAIAAALGQGNGKS